MDQMESMDSMDSTDSMDSMDSVDFAIKVVFYEDIDVLKRLKIVAS